MNTLLLIIIIGLIILFIINFTSNKSKIINKKCRIKPIKYRINDPEFSNHIQIKPTKAIVGYQHRYRKKRQPQDLLNVADVFNWGLPGLMPHKPIAKCIYTKLANGLDPNNEQHRITRINAQERLLQMNDPNEPEIDPREDHYQGPDNNNVPELVHNILNYDLNLAPVNNKKIRKQKTIIKNPDKLIEKYAPYKTDSNSVHDSVVTSSVKKSVDNLKKTLNNNDDNINTIRDYILNNVNEELTNDCREKALKTLDIMCKTNSNISNLGMKEKEILNLVYNRINSCSDEIIKNNLKETLVKELADSVRGNGTVCAVGRVSRLVDTLNVIDPNTNIKDSSTIRREMLNKASMIQQKIYDNLDSDIKKEVDSLKDTDKTTDYENKVKKDITDTLHNDYVNSGIITEKQFKLELDKWINDII